MRGDGLVLRLMPAGAPATSFCESAAHEAHEARELISELISDLISGRRGWAAAACPQSSRPTPILTRLAAGGNDGPETRPGVERSDVHRLFTDTSPTLHRLFTDSSPTLHRLFTQPEELPDPPSARCPGVPQMSWSSHDKHPEDT
ncbi:hypothetical protein EYF80_042492 [Liparis tanakae]|uniref:Uncharacterized protein n=1 Tax=Liparis tanakae TaxID=230148 RepID=A0A4Z2G445_9TELE|nr:hypothetical protein EYF80_042492 [Liparis tanakae]